MSIKLYFMKVGMRPYLRKYHPSWGRRAELSIWTRIRDFLRPFLRDVSAIWTAEPPYPLSLKLAVTTVMLVLLILPLLYFLLVPLLTLAAFQVTTASLIPASCHYYRISVF